MIAWLKESYDSLKKINIEIFIILVVMTLSLLGLVVLASASQSFSKDSYDIFNKQLVRLGVGALLGIGVSFLNIQKLRSLFWVFGAFSFLLLILVLIPGIGVKVNGARRWIELGFVRLQVADVAKLGLILMLAQYLSIHQRYIKTWLRGFIVPSAMVGAVFFLILLQPDFGTAFLCALIGFAMIFLAGVRLKYLIPFLLGGGGLFIGLIFLSPIRLKRLTAFMDVEGNKLDGAYQLWQAILAFVAGGVGGVGLGNGRQQMSFLPEAHTDFIFPVIGEELGLYFSTGVVILFLMLFIAGFRVVNRAPNLFNFLIISGSILCIILQALINIGVVTGLLPTKGIGLPFISYGGSNLILMLVLIAIIINCIRAWNTMPLVQAKEL